MELKENVYEIPVFIHSSGSGLFSISEHGNDLPNYINMEDFLDWPKDCRFLKEGSVRCSNGHHRYDIFYVLHVLPADLTGVIRNQMSRVPIILEPEPS
jgi:hypothetical protein